jgi:cytochrome P450
MESTPVSTSFETIQFSDLRMLSQPHAYLAQLRTHTPVVRAVGPDGHEFFLVTSYRLIEEVTKRSEDFSNKMSHLLLAGGTATAEVAKILEQDAFQEGSLLVTDDPQHKRHRALVNAAFTQGRVANLGPVMDGLIDNLIDAFIGDGKCDFVNQFAVLLPTYIIADILGLERQDYPLVRKWSDAFIGIISQMGTREENLDNAHKIVEFRRFILRAIQNRRAKPADDLISSLVNARVEGLAPLTDVEIAPITLEIAVAGNETTRNTLMSGLAQLIRHPDQLQALIEDPTLAAGAVEEILRYETPATSMWRIAAKDTALGGVSIAEGSDVLLRFDAANRDPEIFEDPDRFDIRRKKALRHLAFGAPGVHRCLGQMLARRELAAAFPKLLGRLHNLRIIEDQSDTRYWPGLLHRGIASLHLAFDPIRR